MTNSHLKDMDMSRVTRPNPARLSEAQRYAIFGVIFGFLFPLVGTIFRLLASQLPLTLFNMFQAQRTDPLLWVVNTAPIVLGLLAAYAGHKQDLLSKANEELRNRESNMEMYKLGLKNVCLIVRRNLKLPMKALSVAQPNSNRLHV